MITCSNSLTSGDFAAVSSEEAWAWLGEAREIGICSAGNEGKEGTAEEAGAEVGVETDEATSIILPKKKWASEL